MPDLYEPPGARAALAQAARLRVTYASAVEVVQRNRQLSKAEKVQRLRMLHTAHQEAMATLRRTRHQAHRDALRQAIRDLAADAAAAPNATRTSIYQQHLERCMGMTVGELTRAFDVAELIDNGLGMQAVAVAALSKRGPLPGDPAAQLVARFAYAQQPDGRGGSRYQFPKAALAFERLGDLESWERSDHIAADATFMVNSTPERPDDPTPPDPTDQARQDVAALYSAGNGQAPAAAAGGGGGEPTAP
jgi:hypothetical protein